MELADDKLFIICWKIFLDKPVRKEEQVLLDEWQKANPNKDYQYIIEKRLHSHYREQLEKKLISEQFWQEYEQKHPDTIALSIQNEPLRLTRLLRYGIAAAACITVLFGACYLFFFRQSPGRMDTRIYMKFDSVSLDSAISILFHNGKTVTVASGYTGVIAEQGSIKLERNTKGEFLYSFKDSTGKPAASQLFNKFRVPGGMLAKIRLTDGSEVFMNEESSIRFPISFTGRPRRIELEGEAYFDIAKDTLKPFTVVTEDKDSVVAVGTLFNVKAYPRHRYKDIALERGTIHIYHGVKRRISNQKEIIRINEYGGFERRNTNFYQMTAYKDGNFYFDSCSLTTILTALEQWYNVKVTPKEPINHSAYYHLDTISRSMPLTRVLQKLEDSRNLHFNVSGEEAGATK